MYTPIICTLPVSPVPDPPFERTISSLTACVTAKLLGIEPIFLLNLIGRQGESLWERPELALQVYREQWQTYCEKQNNYIFVTDNSQEYADFFLSFLQDHRLVSEEQITMSVCDCGACDIPTVAIKQALYSSRSLMHLSGGDLVCRVCHNKLREQRRHVLTSVMTQAVMPTVVPSCFESEVVDLWRSDSNHSVVLSKASQRSKFASYKEKSFGIDSDVWWSLLPAFVSQKGEDLIIVVSYASLPHAIRTVKILSSWCKRDKITLLIHPVLHVQDGKIPIRRAPLSLYRQICKTPFIARTFPFLGFAWQSRHAYLKGSELYLVTQSSKSKRVPTRTSLKEITEVVNIIKRPKLLELLKTRRSWTQHMDSGLIHLDNVLGCEW